MIDRPSIDKTQMDIARLWALRSTCDRAQVGATIVIDGRTVGTGYNGAPAGQPHCNHALPFMPRVQDHAEIPTRISPVRPFSTNTGCRQAIHAETNAIAYAARHGVPTYRASMFVTLSPCFSCAQLIIAAGLARVVYDRTYRDATGLKLLVDAGIYVEKWLE